VLVFQLDDLKPYTNYTIAVRVVNSGGKGPHGENVSVITEEGGVYVCVYVCVYWRLRIYMSHKMTIY